MTGAAPARVDSAERAAHGAWAMEYVHATTVAIDGRGVLIRGAPGGGKSDPALRLIDAGARLVADDQTGLRRDGGRLIAAARAASAGRLEVRGLGIVEVPRLAEAPVGLVVDLVPAEEVQRLPEPASVLLHGVRVPRLAIAPFQASAAAKLRPAARAGGVAGLDDDDKGR